MSRTINPAGGSRPDRDRRVRQADRAGRILNVLRLIQGQGKWNAKSIAGELEVDERTIYRDLQALEFAGVPWYFDAEEQSYRVRSDYRFPVPNLTESEIIGQAVATAITKATGLDVAGTAAGTTHKIAAASNSNTKQLLADTEQIVCVLALQLADHSGHRDTIRKVQRALIQKLRVNGTKSLSGKVAVTVAVGCGRVASLLYPWMGLRWTESTRPTSPTHSGPSSNRSSPKPSPVEGPGPSI